MSFKRMMSVFGIGLLLSIVLRALQLVKTVEYENGFFIEEQKVWGVVLTVLITLICAGVAFCSNKTCENPKRPPRHNVFLSLLAGLVAVSLLNEALNQSLPVTVAPWQIGVIRLITVISAVYFIMVAFCGFFKIEVAPMVHIIPIAYVMIKTVFTFIGVSSLALISDNGLLMAGYCLLMLFFVNYGKLYNRLDKEHNSRKILWTGLTASLICISQSAAYFIVNIIGKEKYFHSDVNVIFTLLFMGLYTLAFTVSYFAGTTGKRRVWHISEHTRLKQNINQSEQ